MLVLRVDITSAVKLELYLCRRSTTAGLKGYFSDFCRTLALGVCGSRTMIKDKCSKAKKLAESRASYVDHDVTRWLSKVLFVLRRVQLRFDQTLRPLFTGPRS